MHLARWAWPESKAVALRWPYSGHKSWQPTGNTHCRPTLQRRRTGLHSQQRRCSCLQRCRSLGSSGCTQRSTRDPGKTDSQWKITWVCAVGSRYRSTLWGWHFQHSHRIDTKGLHRQDSCILGSVVKPSRKTQSLCNCFSPWFQGILPKKRKNEFSLNRCCWIHRKCAK